MGNAWAYVRVSTQEQADGGVSLDAQRAKIASWCALNEYPLMAVFEDAGLSGQRSDNRCGLQAALAACGRGDALVIYSLSRLSRSIRDTLDISDRLARVGVDLVSLSEKIDTTSASGKMIFRLLAVLNEFERDQISERTLAALHYKKSKMEKTGGGIPFGFDLSSDRVHLVENAAEQRIRWQVWTLHQQGWSLRKIANKLHDQGHVARNGQPFHHEQVRRLVQQRRGNDESHHRQTTHDNLSATID